MIGDGFGGRLWYKPVNYTVGSYSAYTVCGEQKQLYSWGDNSYYQLGYQGVSNSVVPLATTGMNEVAYYSTGYLMGVIKTDHTGWVWGKSINTGVKVIEDIKFVDAGANSCAFVKNDGTVWSVGQCLFGEFGDGNAAQAFSTTPTQMLNIHQAVRTAQGFYNTAVLLSNGEVMVAGSNAAGGLGNGSPINNMHIETSPIKVNLLTDIVDIKANSNGFLALDKQGSVWQWGLVNTTIDIIPKKIPQLNNIVAISGCNDGFHFMALDDQKNCYAWGDNSQGQCGDGTKNNIQTPKLVASDVIDIMAGEWFSYIVKTNATLWATGFNGYIWLDLPQKESSSFVQLNPTHPTIGLCEPVDYTGSLGDYTDNIDSTYIPVPHVLYFPNAFTPNNDQVNNVFRAIVKPEASIENFSIIIVNRWGEVMFKSTDVHQAWNGQYHQQDAEIGTYYYRATYKQANRGMQTISGDLTLIR